MARMMKRLFATFVVLLAGARLTSAAIPDTYAPTGTSTGTDHPPSVVTTPPAATPQAQPSSGGGKATAARTIKGGHSASSTQTLAQMQTSLDELTKSNHDLLDLLKQQQSVLEDIQYDRRLQSRQIDNLESRLEEALTEKQQLQVKVDKLELQATQHTSVASPTVAAQPYKEPDVQTTPQSGTVRGKGFVVPGSAPEPNAPPTAPTLETVKAPDATTPASAPPTPSTYLPPEGADNPPAQGASTWHRLFTLKGNDNQQSDVFTVHGKLWRVLWHNQDKPGKLFANTSALFINAFPRDDTIPQKICSKLGTGGDSVEMQGPGNYYVKVEASGGSWELAVEDFH
jgi:hypothetical protein